MKLTHKASRMKVCYLFVCIVIYCILDKLKVLCWLLMCKLKKILTFFFSSENCWCPKIYYNHKCFSGPYLSKGRIASLPKCVGPGPVGLVMKEVLTNLINVAYKSFRVLKELQLEGKPNPKMQQQTIKAKYVTAVS